ncbi:MAG: TraR/DksA family transcriptional regulator [Elusimicrobia bacterium]|nr:TraR/DksA family transcriptional regulator [Elusimicrobiota bacterium]
MKKKKPVRAAKPGPVKMKVKKQAGTQAYEKILNNMRTDIMRIVKGTQGGTLVPADVGDEADQATQSSERELLFELSDNERNSLDAVEAALRKIDTGVYGVCESCRKTIAAPRLKAIPHARYCIGCQARFDTPKA